MVILQSKVEPEFMGRVISVFSMTGSALTPIAMLFFGPLADSISLDFILIGTGMLIFLLGIPFLISRQLREAGRT
jgi:DHA3 family macrolide efflux protein-like MFS transporter